jgi:hypothetical protein
MYDFSAYPAEKAIATKKQTSGGFFSGGGGGGGSTKKPETPKKEDADKKENTEKAEETHSQDENTDVKQEDISKAIHPDIKIPSVINENKTFDDIVSHKSKKEIETLAKYGIINGKTENHYDPDGNMTRAEFATIIVRGLGLKSDKNTIIKVPTAIIPKIARTFKNTSKNVINFPLMLRNDFYYIFLHLADKTLPHPKVF